MAESFYFSHDYSTRSNKKIKNLIRKHGMIAYGAYWSIIEDLYMNANALQLDCDGIAFDLRVSVDIITSLIHDFDLFIIEGGVFSCEGVKERLEKRNEKSEKAKNSALKRWENANALPPHSDSNAIKERKGKKKKENIDIPPPAVSEEFESFQEWQKKNASRVSEMKQPFTEQEFFKLFDEYPHEEIKPLILSMHNYKKLHDNHSANLTFRNWARRKGLTPKQETDTPQVKIPYL